MRHPRWLKLVQQYTLYLDIYRWVAIGCFKIKVYYLSNSKHKTKKLNLYQEMSMKKLCDLFFSKTGDRILARIIWPSAPVSKVFEFLVILLASFLEQNSKAVFTDLHILSPPSKIQTDITSSILGVRGSSLDSRDREILPVSFNNVPFSAQITTMKKYFFS